MSAEFFIQPSCERWLELIRNPPEGSLFGRPLAQWREQTRRELGLAVDRPIVATGHQTLLWHPGILAKYLAVREFAEAHDLVTANLVVDQHAEGFGEFEVPVRRPDGALGVRTIELCRPRPRKDVPMGRHESFTPPRPPTDLSSSPPSVQTGVRRIFEAVYAHRDAPNAALQMAAALTDLMQPWVTPMPNVTSTDLVNTSLARAIMQAMIDDPWRCAESYNRAVAAVPEAGINPLLIRDDYVELPLWRIRDDGRRMHAYDSDVERAMGDMAIEQEGALAKGVGSPNRQIAKSLNFQIDLLPRALFMTTLVRLGMCDLFIHGTGGANYDRTMELWIKDWLGVTPGPIAVVSATLRLPLMDRNVDRGEVAAATIAARRLWHDPALASGATRLSETKRQLLQAIEAAPRNSPQRRAAFHRMHEMLEQLRQSHADAVRQAQQRAALAKRLAVDAEIARRRDWPFPIYPKDMIDALAATAAASLHCRPAHAVVRSA